METNEVIHFKRFNPIDPYRGIGTIQAAAMAIDIDNHSAQWSNNFFYNSAQPNGVLTTAQKLDPEAAKVLKQKWTTEYGGVQNSNKVAILHSGIEYKSIQLSQKDMDFLEQRRFSRDEILTLFRVPKSVLGITEDVNRANAEASDYIFAKRVVRPRMQFIVDRLNEFLLPLFKLDPKSWRYVYDNPVPENEEMEIKEFQAGITSGWLTINEVREREGLEAIEGGDKVYLSAMLAPLEELGLNTKIEPDATTTPDNTPAPKGFKKKRFNGTQKKRRRTIQAQIRKYSPKYKELILSFGKILAGELNSTKGSRIDAKAYQALNIFEKASYISVIALNQADKKWRPEVVDLEEEEVLDNFMKGGLSEWEGLELAGDFDLKNPRAVRWMASRSMENVTTIVNTLKDEARDIIASGLEQGIAYTRIADMIQQFVTDQSDWRADRIARTEVHSAYCGGRGEADRQSGLPLLKEWVVMDGGCCDACQENADAGSIPFDANFPSGDDLPSAHPNCRCDYNTTVADQG